MTQFLSISREKWREVPAGGDLVGRIYSTDLLKLSDNDLLEQWQSMDKAGSDASHRGWYQTIYRSAFVGQRIVELGCGLGFDGIFFMRSGARWVFADIVNDNLSVVKRLVDLLGLSAQAEYLWIEQPESLENLKGAIDAVWANGSLHHAPFDIARREAQILLRSLTPGGRWVELFYPYERWVRQGKLPFSEWGKFTDGERTPWAEWHDAERIKQRLFPACTTTILDYRFGGGQYGWLDLRIDKPVPPDLHSENVGAILSAINLLELPIKNLDGGQISRGNAGLHFKCTGMMWDYACVVEIKGTDLFERFSTTPRCKWAVDLDLSLSSGAAGFVLTGDDLNNFASRETVLDARPFSQRLTLTTEGPEPPRNLLIRNAAYDVKSEGTLNGGVLRAAV